MIMFAGPLSLQPLWPCSCQAFAYWECEGLGQADRGHDLIDSFAFEYLDSCRLAWKACDPDYIKCNTNDPGESREIRVELNC